MEGRSLTSSSDDAKSNNGIRVLRLVIVCLLCIFQRTITAFMVNRPSPKGPDIHIENVTATTTNANITNDFLRTNHSFTTSNTQSQSNSSSSSISLYNGSSSIRHTPMILDLLSWENQSFHEYASLTERRRRNRKREIEAVPVCKPPATEMGGIIPEICCLGSSSTRRGMARGSAGHCSLRNKAGYEKVEQAARWELEQTATLMRNEEAGTHNDVQCDVCRIVELIYQHKLRFVVTGDSMMLQTFSGLWCELARRGYKVEENTTYSTYDAVAVGIRGRTTLTISGPDHWNEPICMIFLSQNAPKNDMSEISDIAANYDVVMMNFGLHWNWPFRSQFRAVMAAVFNAMKHGNIQLLAHRETSAQHFNTSAGGWARGVDNICVPLSTWNETPSEQFHWRESAVLDAATQAGYEVVVANDMSLPRQRKRGANETNELVILPFYNFTAPLFDLHVAECTHYCSTPFLWMPIWRSLRLAMDRQWQTL